MKKTLLDMIEFYAESSPAAVLADQGERARAVAEELNHTPEDKQDDPDESDRLTALLEAVGKVLEADPEFTTNDPRMVTLQRCAQEWVD